MDDKTRKLRILTDDYHGKHEERIITFRHKDIEFERIDREGVTPEQIKALQMAMLVESFIPVFTQYLLRLRRFEGPADEFTIIWAREELTHFRALRSALEALGVSREELEYQINRVRSSKNWDDMVMAEGPFGPKHSEVWRLTNTMIQEKLTEIFYRSLAKQIEDPVVKKQILGALATDEARHCQFMFDTLKIYLEHDPWAWMAAMRAIMDFEMPGYYILENWGTASPEATEAAKIDQKVAFKEVKEKVLSVLGWKAIPAGALMLMRKKFSSPEEIRHSLEI